jgi:PAS domain S-box-containing protein
MQTKTCGSAEDNFITLLNFIADPAVIVDNKGRFLVVNDAFMDLTGLEEKELVGTACMDLKILSAETKALLYKNLEKRLKGTPVGPYEIDIKNQTGETRYTEVKAKKIEYSGQPADLVVFRDITRRKENARQLKEYSEKMEALVNEKVKEIEKNEQKYRELINRMNDTVWVIDFDSKFIDVNDAAVKILGYSREELLSMGPQDIDDSLDAEQIKHFVEQAPTQQTQVLETEHTTKDGRKIPVEISSSLVTYQGKQAFLSIARDITERKKAEEALKTSEKKYRELINGMNDTAWVIGFDAKFIDVNDAAVKMLGYSREDLLNMGPPDIDHSLTKEQILHLIRSMAADQVQVFETAHTTKDGRAIPVEISSSLVTYQAKQAILSIARDISERKKSEAELSESENKYRTLVEQSLQGILIGYFSPFRFVFANQQIANILGYTVDELTALSPEEIKGLIHPDDLSFVLESYREGLLGKRVPQRFEFRMVKKSRNVCWLEVFCALTDYAGKPAIQAIFVDITERKKSEGALKESEEKFRNLSEESPNMIFINKQGRIVYANKKCEALMGYTKEEFYAPAFNFFSLIAPESIEKVKSIYRRHKAGGEVAPYEYDLVTKAGKRIRAVITTKLIKYDGEHAILGIVTDITERKQLENALRESEEMFRAISTSAMDAIILLDDKAKITYWNPAAEKIFGYTNEEAVGKKLDNLVIPPQLHGIHSKTTINHYQKGHNHKKTLETKALRKNGTKFPIELSVTTLEIKDKKHILGIVRDISERQRMEMTLREAEKRYHALFDKAPLGIMLIDKTGTAVEFNEEAHRQLGYSREEFAKLNVSDYEVIETPEDVRGRMKKVLREGKDEFETKHRTKNGEIRDVVNTVQLIELGGKKLFHLITRDVTEQKEMERELKIEKDKLEAVTENIGAGVGIISKDYHILWANKLLKQLNGECEGKMCYSTFNRLTEVCPDCGVKKVFENGVPIDIHEYSNLNDKGNRFWVELIVTPIKDEKGNVIAALELAVNITERKIMENKLAEYSQKLEKIVEERTDQLQQAQAKLVKSERLAAIGELAAMVGHDLRNPLTGIMGAAYYLKTKHIPELGAKAKEMLETIENAIIYSNKIVNDLLEYSRDLKLELSETTPKELLKTALSLTDVPKAIKVVDATKDKPKIKVDAEKLRRVFVNIIRNAFDAMPEGGTLTIKSRNVKGKLEISFQDTGTGMSTETLSKLKGGVPLFTTKAKGMGFGVPICKRIAEAHGGTLSVQSKVGKGTTITITVPAKPKPVDAVKDLWIFNESMIETINARQKTK